MNPRCLGDGPLRTVLWSGIDRTLPAPAIARTGCSRPRTWPLQSTQADEAFPDHRRAALAVRAVQSSGDASKHRVIVPWPIHSSFSHSFEVRRRSGAEMFLAVNALASSVPEPGASGNGRCATPRGGRTGWSDARPAFGGSVQVVRHTGSRCGLRRGVHFNINTVGIRRLRPFVVKSAIVQRRRWVREEPCLVPARCLARAKHGRPRRT